MQSKSKTGTPLPQQIRQAFAPQGVPERFVSAIRLIEEERYRQLGKGYTAAHDDPHTDGSIAAAAAVYCDTVPPLLSGVPPEKVREQILAHGCGEGPWPWEAHALKVEPTPIENLVKAGALIVAEIERLQRMAEDSKGGRQ